MAARRPKRPLRRAQMDGPNGETTALGQREVQTGKTRVMFHRCWKVFELLAFSGLCLKSA